VTVSRRDFLAGAAAGTAGLVIGFYVPNVTRAAPPAPKPPPLPPPNAFLRIGSDDSVSVLLAHSEMGQGIWTGLAMLIAEELDCDWSKVRCEHAPVASVYARVGVGLQMTGGSSSTHSEFDRYRNVGAMAKALLLRAAAARWKTSPAKLTASKGVIAFASAAGQQTLTYGAVAEDAMKLPPPKTVKLKRPEDWTLIGTKVRRLDTPEKITGKAQFGIDVAFAGLRTALVLRPPAFGAKLVKFDASDALRVPGVEQVVKTDNGVAVIAAHFWAAKVGRDALRAEWSAPENGGASSEKILSELRELTRREGTPVVDTGKAQSTKDAIGRAARKLEASYEVPYLAHATMEPLNCSVKIDGDRCQIWTGTQFQSVDQAAAAKILGTTPEKVAIHTMFLGGGFGRRANPASDFVSEAVVVAKAAGVPVKVVWTREDDMRGGYYRPAFVHRVQVGVGETGMPEAWHHVVAGQSLLAGTPFAGGIENGIDRTSVEGVPESPYLDSVKSQHVSLHSPTTPITVLWWRSVGHTHTAFAMESMIDELAHAAGKDPLAYRLALLAGKPRFARLLETAATKAGWGTPPAAGRARGLAVHEAFGSIVAEVAEVSVDGGRIKVHAVTAAIDCGTAVNPLGIEAQVQGSIAFGLSAVLHGKLTIEAGKVAESNFHDYPVLRMSEMPAVSVHVIASDAKMGGIGEPATAPIAPAVANAVFALTGQRLRTLPLQLARQESR
jgi:isoquinoline 1-oxidoreductase beta subunit